MIFLSARRINGEVYASVYVGGQLVMSGYSYPSIAAGLKAAWQWAVDNFISLPIQGHA